VLKKFSKKALNKSSSRAQNRYSKKQLKRVVKTLLLGLHTVSRRLARTIQMQS
jgi:hypothetical protein